MKRIVTLLLAAGLICSAVSNASAVDTRVKGVWDFNFEYSDASFDKSSTNDRFKARQRLRTQIDLVASESLRGVMAFEIGDINWGNSSQGGSLGTDGVNVEVRYAYIDWVVPDTDLRVRMGLSPFVMPGFVAGFRQCSTATARVSCSAMTSTTTSARICSGCVRRTITTKGSFPTVPAGITRTMRLTSSG